VCVRVCIYTVLAVYNKAQAKIISTCEFKLWTFLQGTESIAETYVMSHQSLSRQAKTKSKSPTAVEFGSRTPKSDHLQRCSLRVEHPGQMTTVVRMFRLIVFLSGRIPRLSLFQHSLYVGVAEKSER